MVPDQPDEAACRRFYAARRARFRTPDLLEAAHVLIAPEGQDAATWDLAEAQARAVIAEVGDDPAAFANRLPAPGYKPMAAAFGFGNAGGARTAVPGFADRIVVAYKTRAFEAAVGESNDDMRLAMNSRREIAELSKGAEGAAGSR